MEKQRKMIGIAAAVDMTSRRKLISCAKKLAEQGIDTAVFAAASDDLGKEYLEGECAVFDVISCKSLDGLVICAENNGYADALAERAEQCGTPFVRIKPDLSDAEKAADFFAEKTGARAEVPDTVPPRSEPSYLSDGIMLEQFLSAENMSECFQKISKYTDCFRSTNALYVCLKYGVLYSGAVSDSSKMLMPYIFENGEPSFDFSRSFDKDEMLPSLFEERETASAYVFDALHFLNTVYGYSAARLTAGGTPNDAGAARWRRFAAAGLKVQRTREICANKATEQIRDPLTGLLNMHGYMQAMTERGGDFNDENKLLRIVSLDVENLKGINDSFGFDEGDRVLSRIAVIMSGCAGENDVCVRVGGDEFFIAGIIDSSSESDTLLEELKASIDSYNSSDSRDYGINIFTSKVTAELTDKKVLETLPYEASYQRALSKDSRAKKMGTGASAAAAADDFDPEERKNVITLLNGNLFTYNYQPIVDAKTGEIRAYEALMRSGEFRISPITILNHASAIGRLYDIEKYTLSNTLKFVSNHKDIFEKRYLFINCIPSCTLTTGDFEEIYNAYGECLKNAVIEFTEQTEADEYQLKALLERSARTGFKIAIDDYGTGYSNISNLLTFMPNYVKIDHSLIMNIHKDKRKQHFTKNIIDYAHDNNFKALAEGVELKEELQTVISMGVDLIQGYYTAKPAEFPVNEIQKDIAEEIKTINRKLENKKIRKTYFTGSETEISLMSLDFDGYTDIVINKDSYTLVGNTNYQSELVIRIKDNLDCTLNLVDVSMRNEHMDFCISAGRGGKLTLNISGDVQIAGSIHVPEESSLKITGDGSLTIQSTWNHPYAIGADLQSSYGNIDIRLKNKLFIHLDSDRSVAIGGGYNNSNSPILIESDEVVIEQTGKFTLAVGSVHGPANVLIKNTKFSADMRSADNIVIGSSESSIDTVIENSEINFDLSGNSTGGIVSYSETKDGSVSIRSSKVKLICRAKDICGIGSRETEVAVTLTKCTLDFLCEGTNAVAIGSMYDTGSLSMFRCTGNITVNSGNGTVYGMSDDAVNCEDSNVIITMNA